ncbi:hypothetical protein L1987_75340 [Smallanthus sonchifolius]|uniref:Uncharacterized protein n=1 Tax=Smallanthus sonchifolius TaxID=185202 RepID=A0ACB9A6W9_9ASTR|nr:hypothetical protein L1987_75340 [Smallanthus sonchifolius]
MNSRVQVKKHEVQGHNAWALMPQDPRVDKLTVFDQEPTLIISSGPTFQKLLANSWIRISEPILRLTSRHVDRHQRDHQRGTPPEIDTPPLLIRMLQFRALY